MSDYVHKKVVRLPFPKEIIEKCNTDDIYECQPYLKELLGEFWKNIEKNSFEIEHTDKQYYLDWIYYYSYGENSGNFGNTRMLSQRELYVIKPYFDKLKINYNDEDLRVVEYCYYNCSEAPDYYDIKNDDSDLFIN